MPYDTKRRRAELEQLGGLVDRYAQSRSLPLIIPLVLLVINAALLVGTLMLVQFYGVRMGRWSLVLIVSVVLWVIFSSLWPGSKLLARYGSNFYRKEGDIELEREKIPLWAWVAYCVTFLGPALLTVAWIMPVRWGLTIALTSFGIFVLYAGKKQKEMVLGLVYGVLCLIEAAATAVGVPFPFGGSAWIHAYFVALMIYIVGAGLITMVVVHIYNRAVLRKIKGVGPFDEK